jgi:general secretion pathway protein A
MHVDHWHFTQSPFRSVLDVDRYYPAASHEEALARLEYLVEARRRLGVLVGDAGVGKSLVLRVARERLARKGAEVALVDALGSGTRDLLWQLAAALGTAPREASEVPHLWRLVADRIAENRLQQISTVLLVDDAGQAGPDVLTQLRRLARLDATPAAQWTIVLVAEAQQAARWPESLRESVDLRIELEPWSEADTIGFVQTSLVEAGRLEPIFEDEALAAMYDLTSGVPRRVARLAEFALVAGAAVDLDRIDATMVQTAYDEMAWPAAMAF